MDFEQAIKAHYAVGHWAAMNEGRVRALWAACSGEDPRAPGTAAEAVADTLPAELAPVLKVEPSAAAYAFKAMLSVDGARTPFEMRERARAAWAKVEEHAAQLGRIEEGFGWDRSAAWKHEREVKARGESRINVERIARLAGRMYAALKGNAVRKIPNAPAEVYSVTQGNDVSRLLPSESGQLGVAGLDLPVLYRIASKKAAVYAVRGDRPASKGPLVFLLDESGSMHGARNEWSKAAAIAIARVAAEDKRPVAVVHFSTSISVQYLDPRSPAGVLEMITTFLSGGTYIAGALREGVRQVAALQRMGKKGADLVVVTDGIDELSGQKGALDDAAALGARLFTVAIECEIRESDPLRARASTYTELGDEMLSAEGVIALAGAA